MQNRLSLAELKAKANVVANAEIFTGGVNDGCHLTPEQIKQLNENSKIGRN